MVNVINTQKLFLGLDIGIASAGLVLLNEKGEILENSLRLFSARGTDLNEERRTARQARRLKSRKKIRLEDIRSVLDKHGFNEINLNLCPYELRVKGLECKLEKDEFRMALLHLAKRRGVNYLEDAGEDDAQNEALQKNLELSAQGLHVCQIQLHRLQEHGKVRGTVEYEGELYSNVFKIGDVKKEAMAIIRKQQEFYPKLNNEFLGQYIDILTRKREYYEGPGSEKSRTDYGIYKTNGETHENLFEDLIGNCSIYSIEKRASAFSYTAQEFNFYDGLNNLSVSGRKIKQDEKKEIFETVMKSKTKAINGKAFQKIIAKVCGCEIEDITGFTTTGKKDEVATHTFEGYRTMQKFMLEYSEFDISKIDHNTFDEIAHILTLNTERDAIIKGLKKWLPDTCQHIFELIFEFRKKNSKYFSKWHSFSLKLMREINPMLKELPLNQMQILYNTGLVNNDEDSYAGMKKIPTKQVIEQLYNPTVERSVNEALKMVNAIIKKYGDLDKITVEMPRDKNSEEQALRIKNENKRDNERNKEKEKLIAKYNLNEREFGKSILKLKLLEEQGNLCMYSGKKISESDVINNPNAYEIDHIIPQSISFDDSMQNKVLVCHKRNQAKTNLTPYQYLNFITSSSDWSYEKFKIHVKSLFKAGKITKRKMEYLLEERDLNKYENCYGFINRNLVDTRYASKAVLNSLQKFFKDNDKKTIVSTVRGRQVSQLRKKWRLEKDRGEDFHHCVDAAIIAVFPMLKLWERKTMQVDSETGEIIFDGGFVDDKEYGDLANPKMVGFIGRLKYEIPNSFKVSYKSDRKANRKLTNEQPVSVISGYSLENGAYSKESTSKQEMAVKRIHISQATSQTDKTEKLKNIIEKNGSQLLAYHNCKTMHDALEAIVLENTKSKTPFADHIKKYGKVEISGREIKKVKIIEKEIHACQDISYKYSVSNGKKVALIGQFNWRSDVYFNKTTKRYVFVGLKYNDLSFMKGGVYGISYEEYAKVANRDNVKINNCEVAALIENGVQPKEYTFCFSLYKNEIVSWTNKNSEFKYRFLSRMGESRFEGKLISNIDYLNPPKRPMPTIANGSQHCTKTITDVLGNEFKIKQEKLSLTVKI